MQICRLKMRNFRSVANGEILFGKHTVLIGSNSVGKSTVCEALDLLLGQDRLSRSNAINEHDFYQRNYLDEKGEPILHACSATAPCKCDYGGGAGMH